MQEARVVLGIAQRAAQVGVLEAIGLATGHLVFFCLLVCVTQVSSTLTSTLHKFDLDPLKDPTSDTQITFAKELCDFTCVCWWINPNLPSEREGSWYDFGAGFGVNAIVNCLIGDALLNSFGARRSEIWIDLKDHPWQ